METIYMKLSTVFLTFSLLSSLNANEAVFQKYTELKNDLKSAKIEADRNLILKNRNNNQEVRDYRDVMRDLRLQALYAKVENSYTPYR